MFRGEQVRQYYDMLRWGSVSVVKIGGYVAKEGLGGQRKFTKSGGRNGKRQQSIKKKTFQRGKKFPIIEGKKSLRRKKEGGTGVGQLRTQSSGLG